MVSHCDGHYSGASGVPDERSGLWIGTPESISIRTSIKYEVFMTSVLNQSQGGMCMSGVLRVGVGVPRQGAGP